MGLDTVELIISWEDAFEIQIPDLEAGKVVTVGDAAMWFFKHIELSEPKIPTLEERLLLKVENAIKEIELIDSQLTIDTKLNSIFPKGNLKKNWRIFQSLMELQLPKLNQSDFTNEPIEEKKLWGLITYHSQPPFLESDISRLLECIGALNYEKLINFSSISTLFEVKIIVMGITLDKLGVDIEEVFWNSSFTNDLGAD